MDSMDWSFSFSNTVSHLGTKLHIGRCNGNWPQPRLPLRAVVMQRWSTYALVILCSCAIRCNPFSTRCLYVWRKAPSSESKKFETQLWNGCYGGFGTYRTDFNIGPSIGKTEEDFALPNRISRNTFENNQPGATGTCAALIKTLTCVSDAELLGCLSGWKCRCYNVLHVQSLDQLEARAKSPSHLFKRHDPSDDPYLLFTLGALK